VGAHAIDRLSSLAARRYEVEDVGAPVASGSFPTAGMIVAPCSMRTLSALAAGIADNLLVRAADVQLKERRRLVLVARESPLHLGHLRAMVRVTELGAIVAPPVPAFYHRCSNMGEMIDHFARRAIDLLDVADASISTPWGGL
jgi:4-hydroxy-3-polyprenylbenzoate decarboxylase